MLTKINNDWERLIPKRKKEKAKLFSSLAFKGLKYGRDKDHLMRITLLSMSKS